MAKVNVTAKKDFFDGANQITRVKGSQFLLKEDYAKTLGADVSYEKATKVEKEEVKEKKQEAKVADKAEKKEIKGIEKVHKQSNGKNLKTK